jgi:hypothetical protein
MLNQVATMLCIGTGGALIAAMTLLVCADKPLTHHIARTSSAVEAPVLQSGNSVHFKTPDAWWRPGANPAVGEQVRQSRQSRQLLLRDQRWRDTGAENRYWI